jgi:hypothetical protein
LQDAHWSVHEELQQTPTTQKPDEQSALALHVVPFTSLGLQTPPAQ